MVRRVYVGGSSAEIERAEQAIAELERAGVHVTSTWPIVIRDTAGGANPRDASTADRAHWSAVDLEQLRAADLLWFLVPSTSAPTRGAWLEMGYALAHRKTIVLSGDTRQSIFCALGHEYATDAEALSLILRVTERVPAR